jgi:anthranilate synthase component 2
MKIKWRNFAQNSQGMHILIIDNYDSFVYNVVQMVRRVEGVTVDVMRNDDERLRNLAGYDGIIISPGPDLPEAAGLLMEVIEKYHTAVPMLGICLGFQALAQYFGAKLVNLQRPLHGHESFLTNVDPADPLYKTIPQPIAVGHYHSWIVEPATLPNCLIPTAYDSDGNLMSFTHRTLPIYGLQYHPESIITPSGPRLLRNFLATIQYKFSI